MNKSMYRKPIRILFVCLGNICRSPAAEGIMKSVVEKHGDATRFHIESAGIGNWHVGSLPDERMRRHGLRRGYDFSSRARQIRKEDFDAFDLIVVMDEDNYNELRWRTDSEKQLARLHRISEYFRHHPGQDCVPDPYYGGSKGFELVLDLLEDACEALYATCTETAE